MRSNDFDKIAFIYDRLAKIVFGKNIVNSQKFLLKKIPEHSRVLILGGGSGWILKELFAVKPEVKVCYIEASSEMISKAQKDLANHERVRFIHGTENDIPDQLFETVITNFYLDLFNETSIKLVLGKIKRSLTQDATLVATDFVKQRWWHKIMLAVMYFFFRATSNVEANKLPDWNKAIQELGGRKTESKFFYGDFIEAALFQF